MANTHPPDKVGDVPGPSYGLVQSPGTNSGGNGVDNTAHPPKECHKGDGKHYPPLLAGPSLYRPCDIHRNIMIVSVSKN